MWKCLQLLEVVVLWMRYCVSMRPVTRSWSVSQKEWEVIVNFLTQLSRHIYFVRVTAKWWMRLSHRLKRPPSLSGVNLPYCNFEMGVEITYPRQVLACSNTFLDIHITRCWRRDRCYAFQSNGTVGFRRAHGLSTLQSHDLYTLKSLCRAISKHHCKKNRIIIPLIEDAGQRHPSKTAKHGTFFC